jgi:hypothetical protein
MLSPPDGANLIMKYHVFGSDLPSSYDSSLAFSFKGNVTTRNGTVVSNNATYFAQLTDYKQALDGPLTFGVVHLQTSSAAFASNFTIEITCSL